MSHFTIGSTPSAEVDLFEEDSNIFTPHYSSLPSRIEPPSFSDFTVFQEKTDDLSEWRLASLSDPIIQRTERRAMQCFQLCVGAERVQEVPRQPTEGQRNACAQIAVSAEREPQFITLNENISTPPYSYFSTDLVLRSIPCVAALDSDTYPEQDVEDAISGTVSANSSNCGYESDATTPEERRRYRGSSTGCTYPGVATDRDQRTSLPPSLVRKTSSSSFGDEEEEGWSTVKTRTKAKQPPVKQPAATDGRRTRRGHRRGRKVRERQQTNASVL